MSRKSIIVTILVVIVLLVADVAAASVENRKAADAFADSQQLTTRPYVHINGWPFVVQGIRGHYGYVTVQADPAHTTGAARITIHPLRLSLHGVVTHGGFAGATAERGSGTARVGYRSISAGLGQKVAFAGGGRVVAVLALRVDGRTYRPSVSARPVVQDGEIAFRQIDTTDQKGLPESALGGLDKVFAHSVPLGRFPFGVRPTSLYCSATGMTIYVSGRDLRLGT